MNIETLLAITRELFEDVNIFKESSKLKQYRAKSKDRVKDKERFLNWLTDNGFEFEELSIAGSSIKPIQCRIENISYRFWFKPISGGMTETTLNSTITELIPAVMFNDNIYHDDIQILYDTISKGITSKAFVTEDDQKAGQKFIELMPKSSKFEDKMLNALAIYDYTVSVDADRKIENVYWTYRAKPEGVDKNSPADIVIVFEDKQFLGVSLKAGGESTKEPLFNTYVNRICVFFNIDTKQIEDDLYNITYKHLGLPENYREYKGVYDVLEELETNNSELYNEYYDKNLKYLKSLIIKTFLKDETLFLEYIKKEILQKDDNVPVVVIKAYSGRNWKQLEDNTELLDILPSVLYIYSEDSKTSKQNFYIVLCTQSKEFKMSFSIRSNKGGSRHKLGQFYNLAVKFNGLK